MSNPITDKNFLFEEFSARIPILMLDYFSSNNSNFDSLENTIWLPTCDGFGCSTRKRLEKWVIFEKIIGKPTKKGGTYNDKGEGVKITRKTCKVINGWPLTLSIVYTTSVHKNVKLQCFIIFIITNKKKYSLDDKVNFTCN